MKKDELNKWDEKGKLHCNSLPMEWRSDDSMVSLKGQVNTYHFRIAFS